MIGFLANRKHARLRELVSSYIDDQVTASERREVEEHLASCESCRLDLDSMRFTVGLLNDLPQVESLRDFTLSAPPEPVPVRRSLGWTAGLATSLAAMLLIALLLGDITGLLTQTHQLEQAASSPQPAREALRAAAPAAPAPAPSAPAPAPVPAPAPAPVAPAPAAAAAPSAAPAPQSAPTPETAPAQPALGIAKAAPAAPAPAPLAAPAPAPALKSAPAPVTTPEAQTPASEPTRPEARVESQAVAAQTSVAKTPAAPEESKAAAVTRTAEAEAVQSESESISKTTTPARETTPPPTPEESRTLTSRALAPDTSGEAQTPKPRPDAAPQAAAPTPGPATLVPEAGRVPVPANTPSIESTTDEGLSIPLRQLELAAGALVAVLALATLWAALRSSRRFD